MTVLQFNDIPVLNYDSGNTGFPKYAVSSLLSTRQQRMARSWNEQGGTYRTEDPLLIEIAKTLFPEKYANCTISLQVGADEYQNLKQTIGISDPFKDLRGN